MFPLVAIGGVIGAVFSIAKGASWLSDQLDSSKAPASVGGKGAAKPAADAKSPSQFEAALEAQVTGQTVPASAASTAVTSTQSSVPVSQLGTSYDTLARTKAGLGAYGHVGEHRSSHTKHSTDNSVTRS
jgi:hypothetical protein